MNILIGSKLIAKDVNVDIDKYLLDSIEKSFISSVALDDDSNCKNFFLLSRSIYIKIHFLWNFLPDRRRKVIEFVLKIKIQLYSLNLRRND